jgi:predicted GNAT family acetyltransferase
MEVELFEDATGFQRVALPYLLEHESVNNLILGVSATAVRNPGHDEEFRAWVVHDVDRIVAAAAQTPPHNLILATPGEPQGVRLLAERLGELPGVIGILPYVETFVATRPETAHRTMRQGVYELTNVIPPRPGVGTSRPAMPRERDLLVRWHVAFQEEAVGQVFPGAAEHLVEHRLQGPADEYGFWVHDVNDVVVAMSGHTGPTPNGIRIGPVYTPPESRGNGYASRLVAAESQWLLDSGRRFCFLYTDLENPTSNSIYERIGFRRTAESAEYSFED